MGVGAVFLRNADTAEITDAATTVACGSSFFSSAVAVEIDEDCMLKKRLDVNGEKDLKKYENKNGERKGTTKYKKGME